MMSSNISPAYLLSNLGPKLCSCRKISPLFNRVLARCLSSFMQLRLKMVGAKEVQTPMYVSANLMLDDGSTSCDAIEYRRTIGSLQYLLLTRPYLDFAVNRLAQFMHKSTVTHWQHVKWLLCYVKQTIHFSLLLRHQSNSMLKGFSDADWGGDLDDRKSTTAYMIFMGNNPISWRTMKQKVVARSSTEAEYQALVTAASDIIYCSFQ
ncbi:retrovirus-related Pol polyprotein from transposon RE2 [Vitis vinifera]|uniref:retrovirus-related Pol polyprotein from transposon RE2 n=1 Tax=Vitis vinifera TaxID=29760 RepID=UPI0008FEB96F|nr:retrovirus-related Pol polyprotein from transposon RE2 [Vitis vinifera]|eukprot:XP_019081896.1 PREDICTED: uncharacterized protein LOC109124289 [Vitis vinifera]